jgi:hypothetical protein
MKHEPLDAILYKTQKFRYCTSHFHQLKNKTTKLPLYNLVLRTLIC